jgi:hypothetical protein
MGFENIVMHNGWSQAILGATIVMTGLVILSLAISQIHKLVEFWEHRSPKAAPEPSAVPSGIITTVDDITLEVPVQCPADIHQTAALYQPLVDGLDATFELKELYRQAAKFNLPHPHITIKCLREAGILRSAGKGLFIWNP